MTLFESLPLFAASPPASPPPAPSPPPRDDTFAHTAIRASAGSGKTFQLTNRYLQLIAAGAEPGSILASTFTRLAAGEIRDRILSRLAGAALDETKRRELAKQLSLPSLMRERVVEVLAGLAQRMHIMQIRTLDSFFAAIAKSFAIELNLPLNAEIIDEEQAGALRGEAIRLMLDEQEPQKLIDLLRWLTQGASTRGISGTIDQVVNDLYEISRQAPAEAWECVPDVEGRLARPQLMAAIKVLAETPCPAGKRFADAYKKDCENAHAWNWSAFLKTGLAGAIAEGKSKYHAKPIDRRLLEAYAPLVQHAIAEIVGRARDQTIATRDLLALYARQYEQIKWRRRALTFDDLTNATARAEELGAWDNIAFRLDSQICHVLLDEFQDTSISQWRVLEPIVHEIISVAPPDRTFFCVGDIKQSIYRWRDAAPEVFDELPKLLRGADGSSAIVERELARSYRSSPIVIDAVNQVFLTLDSNAALADDRDAALTWREGFKKHDTEKTKLPGRVDLRVCRTSEEHEKPLQVRLRAAAELAAELHRANPSMSIGILTRTNSAVQRLLYELGPTRLDIGASGRGGGPLTDAAPVNVILDLLQLADHPDDTIAAFNVAMSPAGAMIGLKSFDDQAQRRNVSRTIRQSLLTNGYGRTISEWVSAMASSCDTRELRRLRELIALADAHDVDPELRPGQFIKIVEERKIPDVQPAPVQVMTIHQSKGLEFDAVILAELEAKLTATRGPTVVFEREGNSGGGHTGPITKICRYMNADTLAHVPELRPLFEEHRSRCVRENLSVLYVAMTRAIHGLYMFIDAPGTNKDGSESRNGFKSLAGVVRCALAPSGVMPGSTPFAIGAAEWFKSMQDGPPHEATPSTSEPAIEHIRLARPDRSALRGWAKVAASQRAGESSLRLELQLPDPASRRRGLAIHAMLETVRWLEDFKFDEAAMMNRARDAAPRAGERWARQQMEAFRTMLERPDVHRILLRGERSADALSLHCELPFAHLDAGRLQRGSIDRLVVTRDDQGKSIAAEIVDFKTDQITAKDAMACAERYRAQLESYRDAVAEMFDLQPTAISLRLLFVEPGVIVDL